MGGGSRPSLQLGVPGVPVLERPVLLPQRGRSVQLQRRPSCEGVKWGSAATVSTGPRVA